MKKLILSFFVLFLFSCNSSQNLSGVYVTEEDCLIKSLNFVDDHTVIITENFVMIPKNNEYKILNGNQVTITNGYFVNATFTIQDGNSITTTVQKSDEEGTPTEKQTYIFKKKS